VKKETSLKSRIGKLHWTLKVGLIILVIGTGPLLIVGLLQILGAYEGTGLGFGLLFFVSFWPSIILIVIGVIITALNRKKRFEKPETISEKVG